MNRVSNQRQSTQLTTAKNKCQVGGTPLYKRENMEFFLTNGNATTASIEKFADDQLDFIITNEDVIFMSTFYTSKGVARRTYYNWLEKSSYLKKRHELCLEILGLRREKIMVKSKPSLLAHTQHLYCEDWAAANKYHADLKKKDNEQQPGVIKVFMPRHERTSEVPERKNHTPPKPSFPKEIVEHEGQKWERVS